MIKPEKVEEVERLLADGRFSQRSVAKLARVSRATVAGIADGTRPDYEARRRLKFDDIKEPLGPAIRCPDCGGRVYAPCRLCRVRRLKAAEERARLAAAHRQSRQQVPHRLSA